MRLNKKGVVDQVVVWIFIFTSFVTLFFLTIDYSNSVDIKNNLKDISRYIAKMKSSGRTIDEIVSGVNVLKVGVISSIASSNIVCSTSQDRTNSQLLVTVNITLNNAIFKNQQLSEQSVVYNENGTQEENCTLNLSLASQSN